MLLAGLIDIAVDTMNHSSAHSAVMVRDTALKACSSSLTSNAVLCLQGRMHDSPFISSGSPA